MQSQTFAARTARLFTRPTIGAVAILASLAAVRLAAAEPAGIEERLRALETKVTALTQENATLKQQLGFDAKGKPSAATVTAQGKEAKLAIGGFVHLQGEFGDSPDARFPDNNRFLVRRARLGVKGSFVEDVHFALQADFGNNSLNSTSGYRAQLTDMFVAWKKYSAATLTLGQVKVPYGYEQLQSDLKIPTMERSLANDMLTLPRQIGVMLTGAVLDQRLTYGAFIGNGNGANVSFNDNEAFDYVGRVAGTVFDNKKVKVTVGANAYTSYDTGTFTGERTGTGVDAQLAAGAFEFTGEFLQTKHDRDVGEDYTADGWALMGSYFFVPNRWQGVVRYEEFDPNDNRATDDTTLVTVGVNYLLKGDDIKLSFNYLIGDPPEAAEHRGRFLSRLQVIF